MRQYPRSVVLHGSLRRLPLLLPRISKGLKAVYRDKPASPNAFTLGFSFNVALFDVPTYSAR